MKKKRLSEEQIMGAKGSQAGMQVVDVPQAWNFACHLYRWRSKYGGNNQLKPELDLGGYPRG